MLTGHLCLESIMLIPPHSRMALEEVRTVFKVLSYLVLEGGSVCLHVSFLLILSSSSLLFGIAVAFLLYAMVCGARKSPVFYGYLRYMVNENGVDDFLLSIIV